jgi:hypothetical protein
VLAVTCLRYNDNQIAINIDIVFPITKNILSVSINNWHEQIQAWMNL